jgi:hypothetical protein
LTLRLLRVANAATDIRALMPTAAMCSRSERTAHARDECA